MVFPVVMYGCEKEKKVKPLSRVQLCDPMDCSLPGSSVYGIFQARILEWVAISFSILMFKSCSTTREAGGTGSVVWSLHHSDEIGTSADSHPRDSGVSLNENQKVLWE